VIVTRRNGAPGPGLGDRKRTKTALAIDLRGATPAERLAEFISAGRSTKRTTFGDPGGFDQRRWPVLDVSAPEIMRRKANQNPRCLWFTEMGNGSKSAELNADFARPFLDFAKALIRLRNEAAEAGFQKHFKTLSVLRHLYATIRTDAADGRVDPCRLERRSFETALAGMRRSGVSQATLYAGGQELETIAAFLDRYELAGSVIGYRNSAPAPSAARSSSERPGNPREGGTRLVSDRAWEALGQISRLITQDADRYRMAAVVLLAVGGWRINELLKLAVEVSFLDAPSSQGGRPFAQDADVADMTIWIRYRLSKERRWHEKPIPRIASELVWQAYREIERISAPSREAARFMKENPGRVLLPPAWRSLDREHLVPLSDFAENLLVSGHGRAWAETHEVPVVELAGKGFASLGDIEKALLAQQATGIVGCSLELHELLFIMPLHLCFKDRQPKPHVVEILDENQIRVFLTGADDANGVHSIFKRFPLHNSDGSRLVEKDGSEIRITSHQFRHFVSTEAIKNGSGHFALAEYFGRRSIRPNRAYVHLSEREKMAMARERFGAGTFEGPMAEALRLVPSADRDAISDTISLVTLKTDIGLCIHDWSILPCPHDGQCGGCPESFVRKGDPEQRSRARGLLKRHAALVRTAEAESSPAGSGPSNHLRFHRRMVSALEKVVGIHDDERYPDGTLVQVVAAFEVADHAPTGARRT
jgi:hypothetical protein